MNGDILVHPLQDVNLRGVLGPVRSCSHREDENSLRARGGRRRPPLHTPYDSARRYRGTESALNHCHEFFELDSCTIPVA